MSEQSARYQRSVGGLLGALVVLVVLVVGYVVVRAVFTPRDSTPVRSVDYARVVPAARQAARFDLLAPERLPTGWRATSAGFTSGGRQHWHLGVLTDRSRYVGLEQGDRSVASMVDEFVDPGASHRAPTEVAGRIWATYADAQGDLALVSRQDRTTTLVVGHDVPRQELRSYVTSLR